MAEDTINKTFRATPSFIASEPRVARALFKVLPNSLLGRNGISPSLHELEYRTQPERTLLSH
jgi:hypothetical protein